MKELAWGVLLAMVGALLAATIPAMGHVTAAILGTVTSLRGSGCGSGGDGQGY